jgi:hypothetical protein
MKKRWGALALMGLFALAVAAPPYQNYPGYTQTDIPATSDPVREVLISPATAFNKLTKAYREFHVPHPVMDTGASNGAGDALIRYVHIQAEAASPVATHACSTGDANNFYGCTVNSDGMQEVV